MKHTITAKNLFVCLVLFVFLWGSALRVVELISGNYLFGFDQGRDYLAAYDIVVNHKLTLIGAEVGAGSAGLNALFHGPGYFYLIALMYIVFHGDPYGGIVLMCIFGVGALLLSYLTIKKIFGQHTALIALFLVGVSPLIAPQSRFLWNSHPTSFFIVLVFYLAYKMSKHPRVYAPLALFTACSIYHFEIAIAVPLVLALCISMPVIYRIKDLKTYLYSFLVILLSLSPMIVFEMRHGWMAFRSLGTYVLGGAPGSNGISFLRITDHVQSYINNAKDSFIIEGGILPLWVFKALSVWLFGALFLYSIRVKDVQKRKFFSFLFLTLCVSYVVLLFLNNMVWDYYLIHAHFIFMYVFAYTGALIISNFRRSVWYKGFAVIFMLFLFSMGKSSYTRIMMNYQYDFHDFGGVEKIQGKRIAIDTIYQDAQGKPFSVFTFVPPIYTYPYEYLFKTYGKQTYGYMPGNEKKGLVYLIIEVDGSKPWTYKGWLETVIKDGSVLDTKTLGTGHIIQKRMFSL
jgi:hypothetical protein